MVCVFLLHVAFLKDIAYRSHGICWKKMRVTRFHLSLKVDMLLIAMECNGLKTRMAKNIFILMRSLIMHTCGFLALISLIWKHVIHLLLLHLKIGRLLAHVLVTLCWTLKLMLPSLEKLRPSLILPMICLNLLVRIRVPQKCTCSLCHNLFQLIFMLSAQVLTLSLHHRKLTQPQPKCLWNFTAVNLFKNMSRKSVKTGSV